MSQSSFAGSDVSRRTEPATSSQARSAQINFEKDENVPGGSYLLAASDAGVDIGYVLVGVRSIFVRGMGIEEREVLTTLCDQYLSLPQDLRAKIIARVDAYSRSAISSGSSSAVHVRQPQPK